MRINFLIDIEYHQYCKALTAVNHLTPDQHRSLEQLISPCLALLQTWRSMYALDPVTSTPPPQISRPSPSTSEQQLGAAPWAPHLEECFARGRKNEASDTWPPDWVQEKGAPAPPWVGALSSSLREHGVEMLNLLQTTPFAAGPWR